MLVRQNWSKHRSKWYKVCSVVLLQYQYTIPTFQIQTNTPFIFNGQETVWLKLREWAMLVRWNLSKHRSKCYKVCSCKIIHTPFSLSKVKQIHEKHLSHWTNCLCFNWQILCCQLKDFLYKIVFVKVEFCTLLEYMWICIAGITRITRSRIGR